MLSRSTWIKNMTPKPYLGQSWLSSPTWPHSLTHHSIQPSSSWWLPNLPSFLRQLLSRSIKRQWKFAVEVLLSSCKDDLQKYNVIRSLHNWQWKITLHWDSNSFILRNQCSTILRHNCEQNQLLHWHLEFRVMVDSKKSRPSFKGRGWGIE